MAGKGRKPTTNKAKVLSGNFRPDREREEAVAFDPVNDFPSPPKHLNPDGQEMWNTLGPQLVKAGVLQVVDVYPLQQLCYCWQRHVKKQKADIDITAAEENALKSLFSEFGMSWNARQRLVQGAKPKSNSFANNGNKKT